MILSFTVFPILESIPATHHEFLSLAHPVFLRPTPILPTPFLLCLKVLCLIRQQLEEIRLKQEQLENPGTKKRKENKEQNQGESAGEKSRSRTATRILATNLAYRNRNREKEVSGAVALTFSHKTKLGLLGKGIFAVPY